MSHRREQLQQKIDQLNDYLEAMELLEDIWAELTPYTSHLSDNLQMRLRRYFDFDDSE